MEILVTQQTKKNQKTKHSFCVCLRVACFPVSPRWCVAKLQRFLTEYVCVCGGKACVVQAT